MLDPNPIEKLWWEQAYARSLGYRKPIFDPFEVFKPGKGFIREIIKNLKKECYAIIAQNRSDLSGFAQICNKDRHQKLLRRIRDLQFRLNGVPGHSQGHLTQQDIDRAKEQAIEVYYTGGKLRRAGKDKVGICPFHDDKRPSFTIYDNGHRFKCFSCSASGDCIDFVMKTKNLKFWEAVQLLNHS